VLSSAITKEATTTQVGNKLSSLFMGPAERNHVDPFPANIGLSFCVRGEGIFLTSVGTLSSPNTFGGSGFGGQMFWVDPERELTCVHLVCGYPQLFNSRKRSQQRSDLIISSVTD
jgi:CubicO group peptidase (beta-lactamase class C family)